MLLLKAKLRAKGSEEDDELRTGVLDMFRNLHKAVNSELRSHAVPILPLELLLKEPFGVP